MKSQFIKINDKFDNREQKAFFNSKIKSIRSRCLIYVSSRISGIELDKVVSSFGNSESSIDFLEVGQNDFFDRSREYEFPDGFLFFENIIEVTFKADSDNALIIRFINMILQYLWEKNIPAVACCAYEDLLINNGGYKSTVIPWEK